MSDTDALREEIMEIYQIPEELREKWRQIEPWRDYPGLIAKALEAGCTRNPCRDACPDKGREHDHLCDSGGDFIVFADGTWIGWDLTQPCRLLYPAAGHVAYPPPDIPPACYRADAGFMVHIRGACACPR